MTDLQNRIRANIDELERALSELGNRLLQQSPEGRDLLGQIRAKKEVLAWLAEDVPVADE